MGICPSVGEDFARCVEDLPRDSAAHLSLEAGKKW